MRWPQKFQPVNLLSSHLTACDRFFWLASADAVSQCCGLLRRVRGTENIKSLLALSVLLSVMAAPAAFAQKKDRDATSTGIMEKKSQKEMDEWRAKGDKYMQEQEAAQKKRKACPAKAKEQKLHFKKRRDFMRDCMAA